MQSGADVVTHVPRHGVVEDETVAQMAANGQLSVPTLAMMEAVVRDLAPAGDSYDFSRDSVAKLRAAGVPILPGTDALSHSFLPVPVMPGDPRGVSRHAPRGPGRDRRRRGVDCR